MRVTAIAQGYGGKDKHVLREPGQEFEVSDDAPKASWYEPVDKADVAPAASKRASKQQSPDQDLA